VTYSNDDCSHSSGSITMESWGTDPGTPFGLSMNAVLHNVGNGTTRSVTLDSDGSVVLFE
jgi:hypothetical protein